MLWMDSLAKIGVGVSEGNQMIRFKKISYEQQLFFAQFLTPENFHNSPPDHILNCFLFHSTLKTESKPESSPNLTRNPQMN